MTQTVSTQTRPTYAGALISAESYVTEPADLWQQGLPPAVARAGTAQSPAARRATSSRSLACRRVRSDCAARWRSCAASTSTSAKVMKATATRRPLPGRRRACRLAAKERPRRRSAVSDAGPAADHQPRCAAAAGLLPRLQRLAGAVLRGRSGAPARHGAAAGQGRHRRHRGRDRPRRGAGHGRRGAAGAPRGAALQHAGLGRRLGGAAKTRPGVRHSPGAGGRRRRVAARAGRGRHFAQHRQVRAERVPADDRLGRRRAAFSGPALRAGGQRRRLAGHADQPDGPLVARPQGLDGAAPDPGAQPLLAPAGLCDVPDRRCGSGHAPDHRCREPAVGPWPGRQCRG